MKNLLYIFLYIVLTTCNSAWLGAVSDDSEQSLNQPINDTTVVKEVALYLTMLEYHDLAARCYTYLVNRFPFDVTTLNNQGISHVLAAMDKMNHGEIRYVLPLELSLAHITRGTRSSPYSEEERQYILNHIQAAIQSFKQVTQLDSTWSSAWLNLAIAKILLLAFHREGECHEIHKLLQESFKFAPNAKGRAHILTVKAQLFELDLCAHQDSVQRYLNDVEQLSNEYVDMLDAATREMVKDNVDLYKKGLRHAKSTRTRETLRFDPAWNERLNGILLEEIYSHPYFDSTVQTHFISLIKGDPGFKIAYRTFRHSFLIRVESEKELLYFHRTFPSIPPNIKTSRGIGVGTSKHDVIGDTNEKAKDKDIGYGIPWKIREVSGGEEFMIYQQNKIIFYLNTFDEVQSWILYKVW